MANMPESAPRRNDLRLVHNQKPAATTPKVTADTTAEMVFDVVDVARALPAAALVSLRDYALSLLIQPKLEVV